MSNMGEPTSAVVADTTTLRRLGYRAVEEGWPAPSDRAFDELDPDGQHVGLLLHVIGWDGTFGTKVASDAVDAATFVASFVCLALMKPLGVARTGVQSFLADAREGIREVLSRPWIRVTIAVDVFANFAIAPYFVLGPVVVQQHLDGASDWGLMMAAAAAGGIAGGALTLRWKPRRPLVPAYVALTAIPLALLTLVPPARHW